MGWSGLAGQDNAQECTDTVDYSVRGCAYLVVDTVTEGPKRLLHYLSDPSRVGSVFLPTGAGVEGVVRGGVGFRGPSGRVGGPYSPLSPREAHGDSSPVGHCSHPLRLCSFPSAPVPVRPASLETPFDHVTTGGGLDSK